MQQEGVVALVLSRYDRDSNSFAEIAIYSFMEDQSTILKVIEQGVYVVSVQPIASTKEKFTTIG